MFKDAFWGTLNFLQTIVHKAKYSKLKAVENTTRLKVHLYVSWIVTGDEQILIQAGSLETRTMKRFDHVLSYVHCVNSHIIEALACEKSSCAGE